MRGSAIRWSAVAACLLVCCPASSAFAELSVELPVCWTVRSTYNADAASLQGFGQRFGVELVSLSNEKIDAGGIPLQVNVIDCKTPADAQTVHDFFKTARNASPQKYIRDGNIVYEFLCDNNEVRAKIQDLLGIRKRRVHTYRVAMVVAPLAGGDDARWNELFNVLMHDDETPVIEISGSFEFGSTLALRNEHPEWGAPSYEYSVTPAQETAGDDRVEVTFEELPRKWGVPRLAVTATIPVQAFSSYQPPVPVNTYRLTRATAAWPTEHPELDTPFADDWNAEWPTSKKIGYLHCWVFNTIEYSGDVVGSRYGTIRTLEQGFGHCWDKADVLVALCRKAGIPAREVMGWHRGLGQGHVWAQLYDESQGWISADATASWLGINENYVPIFILEDGRVPFVYTEMPDVTFVMPGQ